MKFKSGLLALLILCSIGSQSMAETLHTYRVYSDDFESSAAYEAFVKGHPGVTFQSYQNDYSFPNVAAETFDLLEKNDFNFDLFSIDTTLYDCQWFMSSGLCADLSESEILQQALGRMHGPVRDRLMYDGKIYGIPSHISFNGLCWVAETWAAAGLTQLDVPTSYAELLDFLEKWAARVKETPEPNIRVFAYFDEGLYNIGSYTRFLTEILLDCYTIQCEYAGEIPTFDTPAFRELLTRTKAVGNALFETEPYVEEGKKTLLNNDPGWLMEAVPTYMIPARLTADQPLLIKGVMDIHLAGAQSEHKDLAMQYLEAAADYLGQRTHILAYMDSEDNDIVSPQWLKTYQQNGDVLYFPGPGPFPVRTGAHWKMRLLIQSFSIDEIHADTLILELDKLVESNK